MVINAFPLWLCLSNHCYDFLMDGPSFGSFAVQRIAIQRTRSISSCTCLHFLASCNVGVQCFRRSVIPNLSPHPLNNIHSFSKCRIWVQFSCQELQKLKIVAASHQPSGHTHILLEN
uniref:Clavata1 receptor kinase family protein n=1 Tax=Rhizophora mucronata TaxID=61149 RepID=A0A2P2JWG6_RHIMU